MTKNLFQYFSLRFILEFDLYIGRARRYLLPIVFVDYLLAFLVFGASVNDYFAFGFFKMRFNGRNEYITYRRFHRILRKCNCRDYIETFRDKREFNRVYADYLRRDVLDLDLVDEKSFVRFFEEHRYVFVTESRGFRGNSVWMYDSQNVNVSELYHKLKQEKDAHYVIEEKIVQHQDLAAFHSSSVNTLRIVTLYDDKRDVVHFMFAKIRIGNKGAYLDNTHAGGISGNIDLETGIINGPGYNVLDGKEFLLHPISGKPIVGFQIPFWQECKLFIEKVAKITPQIRYVGWDVVVLPDGCFSLIEANDNADHDGQQIHNKGMWKQYRTLINKLK